MVELAGENMSVSSLNGSSIDVRYGYCVLFGAIFFFQVLNKFVSYLGPPKTLKDSEDEFWKYKNVLISWIHACIVGPWTLACALFLNEYWTDSIVYVEIYGYSLLAFSTGYFLYDCFDCIVNNKVFKMWEVCLHHVAVISTFLYNLVQVKFVGYVIYALLVEVNSIFLHARKLMQMAKVDFNHSFYKLNNIFNILTFSIFRFGALVIITYGMASLYEYKRILVHGSQGYCITLMASMFTMWVINPILYWRLVKNDFLRKKHYRSKSENSLDVNGSNNNVKKVD
ncbi:TLC domain-containing protein 2-like [Lineus longissimus]|uniref:TLC domain-containing protein 2-like n=1 Tax=Lineus longissimus TaxID=88925 RepID=UPI002B4F7A67